MNDVFTNKGFLGNPCNDHGAVAAEDNDVINVRTVAHKFAFTPFQTDAYEAFFGIDVEFGVCNRHFCAVDGIEGFDFGFAFAAGTKIFLQLFKVINGVFNQVIKVVLHVVNFLFEGSNTFVGFKAVEP